ncbi:cell division protease ftsH [Pyricularia oryzae 70-15]|uniref:Cell division protease ftsH n=3 Tax=Pyricularia oryzae TaxID=318829 RepID=G4NH61_PYRO7|nr:cell division protease ftsH [Pyricularia oryzae 70-15]EHA47571.1 cell division protease ftsH [Pyricularia oryzae 70-15]ELQ41847.1 cell division protease ftsH [Pyricularia oryzae Y34]KAI7914829.1 cell division protease ftsH [Pyricularia oryzae]KAI7932016.1 cell division protease ftsH [Pyricularia oryzae]
MAPHASALPNMAAAASIAGSLATRRAIFLPNSASRIIRSTASESLIANSIIRTYSALQSPSRLFRNAPLGASTGRHIQAASGSNLQFPHQRLFMSGISRTLLAQREETANRNPSSASAQNAFYQTLLKANMPAIIVERHQSGHFASNDATREVYNRARAMLEGSQGASNSVAANGEFVEDTSRLRAVGQAVAARSMGGNISSARETANGPIRVVVDESRGSQIFRWVKFVAYFAFVAYVSMVVLGIVFDMFTSVNKKMSTQKHMEVKADKQKTRFKDVHGCEEAKEELQDLVEFLKNPDKFSSLGGKLPKGVLLVGPPGTGKTLLARAVAGEAGVPFFYMSGSEFEEVFVGVGARRVRDLFTAAKTASPAIVFIDELDAIGGKRNAKDPSYAKQTLNQLLTELDGFEQDSGVIVIAATNFPRSLDKALTRPGRFDRHVQVDLPDIRGRIAILKHHATKIKADDNIDYEAIARSTPGLSGAELESIVNQAAIHASKTRKTIVSTKDFDWAKDKVIMGAERRSMVISPKEKEMTAYHEAGHALITLYTQDSPNKLYKVTILPRGPSLGHTAYLPEMDKYSYTVKDYKAQIDSLLGGKIAEQLAFGDDMVTSGVSNDLERATDLAYRMVSRWGMSERLGPMEYGRTFENLSSSTKAVIEAEVKTILEVAQERGAKLLKDKRVELDRLAKALVQYETLDVEEVKKVIRGEDLEGRTKVPENSILVVPKPDSDKPFSGGSGPPAPLPPVPAPV